jgi:hypothetical protein
MNTSNTKTSAMRETVLQGWMATMPTNVTAEQREQAAKSCERRANSGQRTPFHGTELTADELREIARRLRAQGA